MSLCAGPPIACHLPPVCLQSFVHACSCTHTCLFSHANTLNQKSQLACHCVIQSVSVLLLSLSFFSYQLLCFVVPKANQMKRDTVFSAALADCRWLMHLLLECCLLTAEQHGSSGTFSRTCWVSFTAHQHADSVAPISRFILFCCARNSEYDVESNRLFIEITAFMKISVFCLG